MKNRFASTKKKKKLLSPLLDIVLPVIFFAVVIWLFDFGVNNITSAAEKERLRAAEQAVMKAAVQCYALEGQYPPSIAYMHEHYGLNVDEEIYIIHYEVIASNLIPQIFVLPRNLEGSTPAPEDII